MLILYYYSNVKYILIQFKSIISSTSLHHQPRSHNQIIRQIFDVVKLQIFIWKMVHTINIIYYIKINNLKSLVLSKI